MNLKGWHLHRHRTFRMEKTQFSIIPKALAASRTVVMVTE
uniref:Uncharacterized protein n=2 Tax=Anguilla anguilla TaxID=7936 RepID=A0A0E9SCV6_ANGAN